LDRLDFWVAELKKRGIYIDLNLNVGRSYKPGDGVADSDKIRWGKGLTFYDPRLIELQKEYAKALLTHRNPYTKLEYRAEPAIAIVEICNENALYVGFRAPTPHYENELDEIYNAWLTRKRTPTEIARLREIAGVASDKPIPRLASREAAPKERLDIELQFFHQMQTTHLVALAVDMPFVTREQLCFLWTLASEGRGVVPVIGERAEPLAAVYPAEAGVDFAAALAGTDFSLQRIIRKLAADEKVRLYAVPVKDEHLYRSVNEPEDFKEGRFPNRPSDNVGGLETAAP